MAKIGLWDLEATSLTANWGTLLCGGIKEYGKKGVEIFSVDDYPEYTKDPTNDRRLVTDLRDRLSDFDVWVTWYGRRYDVPMLNSRLVFHGLATLPRIPHVDGWETARKELKLTSNRLVSVQGFLGLKEEKSPVEGTTWVKAIAGDRKSLRYIQEHCRKDVLVLEEAYTRLRPLMYGSHPNVAIVDKEPNGCPICGKATLQKRGFSIAAASVYQRFYCTSCGGHSKGKPQSSKQLAR